MDIPRIEATRDGLDFYREHVLARKPAIVRNATTWPAFGKWSLGFFRERYGKHVVRINMQEWTMADFIDQVDVSTKKDPAPYLKEWPINKEIPELMPDISPAPAITSPNWLGGNFLPKRWGHYGGVPELLIGGCGSGFPYLHFDQLHLHAFITQVVGGKDFVMFHPDDTPYLYPVAAGRANRTNLRDVRNVDLEKYPLFAKATPIRFRAEPGDSVFIPNGWWHTTYLDEPSIAVSLNVANASNWRGMSQDMRFQRDIRYRETRLSGRSIGGSSAPSRRGCQTTRSGMTWLCQRAGSRSAPRG